MGWGGTRPMEACSPCYLPVLKRIAPAQFGINMLQGPGQVVRPGYKMPQVAVIPGRHGIFKIAGRHQAVEHIVRSKLKKFISFSPGEVQRDPVASPYLKLVERQRAVRKIQVAVIGIFRTGR